MKQSNPSTPHAAQLQSFLSVPPLKNAATGTALDSPIFDAILCPMPFIRASDCGPTAPSVSIATGQNRWLARRQQYFSTFLSSAHSATFPASWVALKITGYSYGIIFKSQALACARGFGIYRLVSREVE